MDVIDAEITVSSIGTVVAGNSITISYSVTNKGTVSHSFGVGGEIRQGSSVKADLGQKRTETISEGYSGSGSFTYIIPSSWSAGTYTAPAIVWEGTPGSSDWVG